MVLQGFQLRRGRIRMLCQVFCYPGEVHKPAVDAGPKPFSSLCSHVLAKLQILAGIERAETVGAILTREVMTRIVFAI